MHGEITVDVGGSTLGRWLLPQNHPTQLGRASGSAIRIRQPWVPRVLATLTSHERGWFLENGPRTRMHAQSRWVRDSWFEPNAVVMLQPGEWRLRWDLDDRCSCRIRISHVRRRDAAGLPYALNTRPPADTAPAAATDLAVNDLRLSSQKRHQLAVLFAHLIEDRPPPENLCAAAGAQLGLTEVQVKRIAYKVRERVNAHRRSAITTLEELGYYLTVVSGELRPRRPLPLRGDPRPLTARPLPSTVWTRRRHRPRGGATMMNSTQTQAAGASHVGLVRGNNEDAYAIADDIWAVADGLGGHAGGEVASRLAVDAAVDALMSDGDRDPAAALAAAFRAAHEAVDQVAAEDLAIADMGTTLVLAWRSGEGDIRIGNVGDSRAYLLRDDDLELLTTDDNHAQELYEQGLLTAEQARVHPGRFMLSKAIGLGEAVAPEPRVSTLHRRSGRLLLCSDGLNSELPKHEIAAALADGTPAEAADRLVQAALDAGGGDNVTVVVVDLSENGAP